MSPEIARSMLELFKQSGSLAQNAEARTSKGIPCRYDSKAATSWSLDGALFKVAGPERACKEAVPLAELLTGRSLSEVPSQGLTSLMNYNDMQATYLNAIQILRHFADGG